MKPRIAVGAALVVSLTACSPARPASTATPASAAPASTAPASTAPARAVSPGPAPAAPSPSRAAATPAASNSKLLVAVGDIACDPSTAAFAHPSRSQCQMSATERVAAGLHPDVVAVLGDTQYDRGASAAYARSYNRSWGKLLPITRPAIGNHEYGTAGGAGYFRYFAGRGGTQGKGWYSYNLGAWHIVVLNSECAYAGGCGTRSPQVRWLTADLAAHPSACTLAYWHEPRFSSGPHGSNATFGPFWRALYKAHVDVVLNGHDHTYERFDRLNPDAHTDVHGAREFVVGTGGESLYSFRTVRAHSQVRNNTTFGVLALTLHAASYDWKFVPAAGGTFTDRGTTACH
ncbi:MAG: hypothetical protein QOF57_1543 [Frankiaceae bacterium]|nr:hypothetical protein [Frankiaceae bacterium]